MNLKLPEPIYNCITFFTSENLLVICGGENVEGPKSQVLQINISSKEINPLEDLPVKSSFLLPIYYYDRSLDLFPIKDGDIKKLPEHIQYFINLPGREFE